MGETKKGDVDRMRDKGPELPLLGDKHRRTKGGGLGWLLHEGLDIFEAKVLAFRETGEPICARTDKKILDMIAGQARNDKVVLTTHMIRRARHRLGYKAFEKQVKPKAVPPSAVTISYPTAHEELERLGKQVAGEAVSDVDVTGAPGREEKISGEATSCSQARPGCENLGHGETPKLNLRWDEKVMAEAIERLASGLPPSSKDEEVVMRAIRSQVEAVTMAASPKFHGMLCMFPDGMKEYMRCVFKVLEALGTVGQDPKAKCFGGWHRMNTADCNGCHVLASCFKISTDAQMKMDTVKLTRTVPAVQAETATSPV
jgi:hypothetical protein